MTTRTFSERAKDIELVADAITNAMKAALPSMIRKEVELQLRTSSAIDDEPIRPERGTLPRPEKS